MQNARQVSRRPRSLSNGSANARRVELRRRRRLQPRRREGRLTVTAPAPEGVRPAAGVRRRRAAAHGGSDGPILRGGARVAGKDAGRMRAEGGVRGEGEREPG